MATQTLLVTGGCGYLGSQFIRGGAEGGGGLRIRVLDNMHSGSYQALMELPEAVNYQFMEGDLLNPAAVRAALRGVDAVVHLAAIVHTPMGYENPTWTEQVNHWGTARLVEACLDAGVQRFVYASSIAVYGPASSSAHVCDEEEACRPVGPYAESKRNAERSVLAARERGLEATVLRFGVLHGYAATTRFDAVVNRFAYLAGVRRPLTIHGTGEQHRPFIHVQDAGGALHFALAHAEETAGEVFNVASENASVLDVAAAVRAVRPAVETRYTDQDARTQLHFVADSAKIKALGWTSQKTVEESVADLVGRFQNIERVTLGA